MQISLLKITTKPLFEKQCGFLNYKKCDSCHQCQHSKRGVLALRIAYNSISWNHMNLWLSIQVAKVACEELTVSLVAFAAW